MCSVIKKNVLLLFFLDFPNTENTPLSNLVTVKAIS